MNTAVYLFSNHNLYLIKSQANSIEYIFNTIVTKANDGMAKNELKKLLICFEDLLNHSCYNERVYVNELIKKSDNPNEKYSFYTIKFDNKSYINRLEKLGIKQEDNLLIDHDLLCYDYKNCDVNDILFDYNINTLNIVNSINTFKKSKIYLDFCNKYSDIVKDIEENVKNKHNSLKKDGYTVKSYDVI